MKLLITFLLTVSFNSSSFGKSLLPHDACTSLAVETSIVAFSPDTIGMVLVSHKLNNAKGVEFIDTTRSSIHEEMKTFCNDKKDARSIEDFNQKYHAVCSDKCQENTAAFKMNKDADSVCLSVCISSYRSLKMFEKGAELEKKNNGNADCSAGVDGSDRGLVKEVNSNISKKVKPLPSSTSGQ